MKEQEALKAKLQREVAELEQRAANLQAAVDNAEAIKQEKLRRAKLESKQALTRAKKQWQEQEEKEFAKMMEKRAPAIKAKVVKALEPEVHRLISQNRAALERQREIDAKWLEDQKAALQAEHEQILAEDKIRLEEESRQRLAKLCAENDAKVERLRRELEEEAEEDRRAEARLIEEEKRAHVHRMAKADATHQAALEQLWLDSKRQSSELIVAHERAMQAERQRVYEQEADRQAVHEAVCAAAVAELWREYDATKEDTLAAKLAPIEAKYDREVKAVEARLAEEAERDRRAFMADLEARRRAKIEEFENTKQNLEGRVEAVKAEHDATLAKQTAIELEIDRVEASTAAIKAASALAQADIDGHEGKMAAQAAAAAKKELREDVDLDAKIGERRRDIEREHANFAFMTAKMAFTEKEQALEMGALLDAQARELQEIEAKIALKLQRQDDTKREKLAELEKVRAMNDVLEAELAQCRARDLLRESDDGDEPLPARPHHGSRRRKWEKSLQCAVTTQRRGAP